MLPAVYQLLLASPAVVALIGDRAYRHGTAPQGVQAPYVTWFVPGGAPENGLDGPQADFSRVQVDAWADKDAQVVQVATAVRAALEKGGVCVGFAGDGRDFETQRFRMGYLFDFITPS